MRRLGPVRVRLNQSKGQIMKTYSQGYSLREIALFHDTSHGSIRSLLIEEGVKIRKPGRSRKENQNGSNS